MSKIEAFWENATADDVAGIVKTGKPIPARFRDEETEDWLDCSLAGWKLAKHLPSARWIDADCVMWNQCQVYREPSWHADKPDPGPGYRLLGKFPDEDLKPGDEYFDKITGRWHLSVHAKTQEQQPVENWYRRRIEPAPKFSVGQTVRVIGPKARPARNWTAAMDEHIEQVYTVISVQSYPGYSSGTADFYSVKGVVDWAFREDYLEPVEPEPQHYVLRVGDTVETPTGRKIKVISRTETQEVYALMPGNRVALPNGQTITITEKGFEVTQ